MKRFFCCAVALVLVCTAFAPLVATADHPKGYWPYHVAYTEAVEKGDVEEILRTGDALLNFYSKYEINTDIAANSYNVYYYRYFNSIYEKRGDYKAAKENLEKLLYVSEIAGIDGMEVITESKGRKIDTHMGVYALTEASQGTVYYGAKNELRDGVYYGRVFTHENYKLNDADKIANESIVSLYLQLGKEKVSDYQWLLEQVDFSGKALHVAYNFPNEGQTVTEINQGLHDESIRANLRDIAKLDYPVFLRIGAEMNVWTTPTDPQAFQQAYIRIAEMARGLAPNAALIFSVNYVGSYGDDMAAYYPGDAYVDWVGVSLYCNRFRDSSTREEGEDFGNMYFGANDWADPIASVAETVEKFGDRKPIMVTEGGAGNYLVSAGMDLSDFAASRITHAYRALTMVYPQIKGIIYFDTNVADSDYQYDLEQSSKAEAAFNSAVAENKSLTHDRRKAAMHYVPLENFCEKTDAVSVYAYCNAHYNGTMQVDYYLDGAKVLHAEDVVHELSLPTETLSVGAHIFQVVFTAENFSRTEQYTLTKNDFGVVEFTKNGEKVPAVHASGWAVPEITAAAELGIVPDAVLTDFTEKITRAEFCTLIVQMLAKRIHAPAVQYLAWERGVEIDENAFTDTKQAEVLVAYAIGILNGRGNGIFDPDSSITRQEAAVMLRNAANIMGVEPENAPAFSDSGEFASWAADAIGFISAVKDKTSGAAVMGGVGNNCFGPKGTYTKEQAILTAVRLFRADER